MRKKIITAYTVILICSLSLLTANGQSPEKMSYQAVIRNSSDALVTNTQVGMQISILQGSASESAVYVETQTPTTNANGLISIEIGGDDATVVTGSFATIDWASGPYFIKTETDPTGGTSYTITGTSQLLSVPYALHAKTAETVTETDPVYSASQAVGITATDITNLSNLSGTNTGDQDLSVLASKIALGDSTAQIRSEIPTVTTYSVGDVAQGGIVFWVDETGQHGLVCCFAEQSAGIRWYAGTNGYTWANGDGVFAGEANTSIIIAAQVAIGDDGDDYAARVCNELQITFGDKTYGDWYLPSKEELNLMYQNKATINASATVYGGDIFSDVDTYWSSTEYDSDYAYFQYFDGGGQSGAPKLFDGGRVRAIRAF